jgi:hypothetical protein
VSDSFRPESLTPETKTSASTLLGLSERVAAAGPVVMDNRRRPGRPPGSRNRITVEREAAQKDDKAKADAAKSKKERTEKVNELANKLTEDFNQQLMSFLISQGVQPSYLYKDGISPIKKASIYTPLGEQIAVQPFTANAVASFLVQLEENASDSAALERLTTGTSGLILRGGFALLCAGIYVRGLAQAYERLQPVLKAQKVYKQEREKADFQQQPITVPGGITG